MLETKLETYDTTDSTRKVRVENCLELADPKPVKACGVTIEIGTSYPALSPGAICFTILQHEIWKFCRQIFTFDTLRGKGVDLQKAEIPPCYERIEANPYPPNTGGLFYHWATLSTRASANVYHVGFVVDRLFPNFLRRYTIENGVRFCCGANLLVVMVSSFYSIA